MSLQRTVLMGAALSISLGLGVASSVIISPLPAQAEDTQISQTTSVDQIRTPARVNRLIQNEELAEVELLTTGDVVTIDISAIPEVRDLSPGDYVIITSADEVVTTDNVISVEEVSEDEANALATESSSTSTSETTTGSQTSVTRTQTTVETQQQVTPRPAPAPAPAPRATPAPAPAPVRALW